jgi:hypothetical protein
MQPQSAQGFSGVAAKARKRSIGGREVSMLGGLAWPMRKSMQA